MPRRADNPRDDPRSDLDLIDALNRGEADAFDTLYLRHRDYAIRIAMRFAGERELALDAVQDSFVYFYKKFPGFTLTAKLTTFLYPVLKHNALSAKQKARRTQGDTPEAALASQAGTDRADDPAQADAPGDLHAVLANLPDAQREVLVLRFVDGLSLEEIAEAVDIPLGTVKTRVHHAIRKLRDDPLAKKHFAP
ncbi:MAG: RNA polymerase sigma factor [Phycisphaeraceae bacterium]